MTDDLLDEAMALIRNQEHNQASEVFDRAVQVSQAISLKRIADALVDPLMQIEEAIDNAPRPSPQTTAREMERVQKHYADRNARITIAKNAMLATELDVTTWDHGAFHELAEAVVDALPGPAKQPSPEVAALAAKYSAMSEDELLKIYVDHGPDRIIAEIKTLAAALTPKET